MKFNTTIFFQELLCNQSVPESWARESQENMQGSRNSRWIFKTFSKKPTKSSGSRRSSSREMQRTWYEELRMRCGPTGPTPTTRSSRKGLWFPHKIKTPGRELERAPGRGICCKATWSKLEERQPGLGDESESSNPTCMTSWRRWRFVSRWVQGCR